MLAAPTGGSWLHYNSLIPFPTCSLMKGMPMPSVSTGYLVLNLVLGSFGAGYLFYGRKNGNMLALFSGLLLMVVPALISAPLPLLLTGLLLLALPFLFRG